MRNFIKLAEYGRRVSREKLKIPRRKGSGRESAGLRFETSSRERDDENKKRGLLCC